MIVKYGGVETETTIWVYEYKGGKYKKAKGAVYETWYPSLYNYTSGNGLVLQERGISEDYCETVTLVTLILQNRKRQCHARLKYIHDKEGKKYTNT